VVQKKTIRNNYAVPTSFRRSCATGVVSSDLAARANWAVLNNTMGSDHSPTLVKIDELGDPHINDYPCHSFNMTRADWSQFKRACEDSFTNGENSVDGDVDNMYEDMVQNIISAAEKCIPRTRPKCHQKRLPYWNQNCRDAVYARNRARNKMNKNRTPENVEAYRKLKGVSQKKQ